MKLFYITRVSVPGHAAQSVQIDNMAQAFHGRLGSDFELIASRKVGAVNREHSYAATRYAVGDRPSNPIYYMRFAAKAALTGLTMRDSLVFTRDIAVAAASVACGGRSIYELHRPPMTPVGVHLTRWLSAQPRAGFVAISQALADFYLDAYPIATERLCVAHDGAFPDAFPKVTATERARLRAELSLPENRRLLVHTGSLHKGGAELFGQILACFGEDALLVHIGGKQEDVDYWRAHYAHEGLTNLLFLPHVTPQSARAFQRVADLLLYINTKQNPIYWCTSPLKVFEYMASGVPILGSNIGSVGEVLTEANAFCFDPDEPGSLAQASARARDDLEGAARRADAARAMIVQKYSWDQRAARILDFAKGLGR